MKQFSQDQLALGRIAGKREDGKAACSALGENSITLLLLPGFNIVSSAKSESLKGS